MVETPNLRLETPKLGCVGTGDPKVRVHWGAEQQSGGWRPQWRPQGWDLWGAGDPKVGVCGVGDSKVGVGDPRVEVGDPKVGVCGAETPRLGHNEGLGGGALGSVG